jgi:hypothetical protein
VKREGIAGMSALTRNGASQGPFLPRRRCARYCPARKLVHSGAGRVFWGSRGVVSPRAVTHLCAGSSNHEGLDEPVVQAAATILPERQCRS